MFLGNPVLRGANERIKMTPSEIEEYIKCKNDIIHFAENYFFVQTINEGRKVIKLWDFQKKVLKCFKETPNNKRHICLLASRQVGKSTLATIYLCHTILFAKDSNYAVLANKEATAQEILSRIQMAYENFPLWLQKGVIEWNKKSFTLENNVKIFSGSTSSNSIRGHSLSGLLLDEAGFVMNNLFEQFWNSILPTISSGKNSKIILVSTANGMNHFYNIYKDAVNGSNDFYPIKVTWRDRPDYDDEWARKTRMNMSEKSWRQEFGCVFAGSTNTLIDGDTLESIRSISPVDYKYQTSMHIYEHPQEKERYILGVDCAKGTGDDYSVIQVLKINHSESIEQVAVYRDNMIRPEEFAQVCIAVAQYYNNAYMNVENNDVGSMVCDKIWNDYECELLLNLDPKGLGIRSTKKTKLEGNLLLKEYLEKGWLKINDINTIKELSIYEEISPNVFHAKGQNDNDDLVCAIIWGIYYLRTPFYDPDINDRSDAKNIDRKYLLDEDKPIFLSSSDSYGYDNNIPSHYYGNDNQNNSYFGW